MTTQSDFVQMVNEAEENAAMKAPTPMAQETRDYIERREQELIRAGDYEAAQVFMSQEMPTLL